MNFARLVVTLAMIVVIMSCGGSDGPKASNDSGGAGQEGEEHTNWLIPVGQVMDGGPGKDGIPSIDAPVFAKNRSAFWRDFDDDILIVGVIDKGVAKAYPHNILNWHEIVNDNEQGSSLTISYCPLTGSAISWRNDGVAGTEKTFGVSGLLYNSNLILYDRASNSNWSQMQQRSVSGVAAGESLSERLILNIETTWGQWKRWFPETLILSVDLDFNRNYELYPYGDYLTSSETLFPVDNQDDQRLFAKSRVVTVITDSETKVYEISQFAQDFEVINDQVGDTKVVVVGSSDSRFGLAFERTLEDGSELDFVPVMDGTNFLIEDQNGNQWNILGKGVSEAVVGQSLTHVNHYTAFWFAAAAFFTAPTIYAF